ncbi:MAG: hypothetical protein MUP09_02280 [Thiovulaceae bacterium]|nr:hypothetical protein [Sulfurimonadaceae bacterium]
MRLSVFTNTKIFTLEGGAKDIFMHLVLTPDENNQVMPVQHFDAKMLQRAKNLTLDNGIDATIKNEIIKAFEELHEGDRFLMNKAFVTDIKGGEVAYYWRIVALLNDGSNRTPNEAQAVARIGEREFNIKLKDAQ